MTDPTPKAPRTLRGGTRPVSGDSETVIRRNFLRSSGVIALALLLNAGLNVLLLGWLVRQGGFDLVGRWFFMNAILLFAAVVDLGFMPALTRQVARNGIAATLPYLRWLIGRLGLLCLGAGLVMLVLGQILPVERSLLIGGTLAALAGALQVMSGWAIALRLGQHEQFWVSVKSVVKVVTQAGLVVVLLGQFPTPPAVIFGASLLIGSLCETGLTLALLWRFRPDLRDARRSPSPSLRDVLALSAGFTSASLLQRIQEPVTRTLVVWLAGPAALGIFTVAFRLPMVLRDSMGEAMRAFLPGLSQLQKEGASEATHAILRDGILVQMLVMTPAFLFLLSQSALVLELWLGTISDPLLFSTRILIVSLALSSVSIPFFWALQAFGDAGRIALSTGISLTLVVLGGGTVLWSTSGSVAAFSAVFLVSHSVTTGLIFYWSETRWRAVRPSLNQIALDRVGFFLAGLGGLAWWLSRPSSMAGDPLTLLGVNTLLYAVPYALILVVLYRRGAFRRTGAAPAPARRET